MLSVRPRYADRSIKRRRTLSKTGLIPVSASAAESNLASRVVALSKLVKGLKPEIKFIDVDVSGTNVSTANGLVTLMTPITQGVTVSNRVGEAVKLVSWQINFQAIPDTSASNVMPCFRFYVVQDMQQAVDTVPTGALLVDQPSLPQIQLLNINQQKRFRILFDSKPQTLPTGSQSASGSFTQTLTRLQYNWKKSCSIAQRWNGAANTDIQKNGLYLFVYSNQLTSAASSFDYTATTRVGFTDL